MGSNSRSYYNREDAVGGQIRAKSDRKANERAQEYNRALVTVNQKKKEEELQQGMVAQLMMQQQTQLQMQKLQDLAAGLDLQSKMIDNKLTALQQAQPIPFGPEALPQVDVPGGLPQGIPMRGDNIPPEMVSDFGGTAQGAAANARPELMPQGSGLPPGNIPIEELGQHARPTLMPQGVAPNATVPPPFM